MGNRQSNDCTKRHNDIEYQHVESHAIQDIEPTMSSSLQEVVIHKKPINDPSLQEPNKFQQPIIFHSDY